MGGGGEETRRTVVVLAVHVCEVHRVFDRLRPGRAFECEEGVTLGDGGELEKVAGYDELCGMRVSEIN